MSGQRQAWLWCVFSVFSVSCAGTATTPAESVAEQRNVTQGDSSEEPELSEESYQFPRIPVLDCTVSEEVGYRKGRKFPIQVVAIDGRMVELAAADAYWKMQLAAAKDGVELPVYSGFRTHDDQKYFFDCYKTCSCNSCIRAARPGYSKHQSGRAIDFGQWDGVLDWLKANAKRYRFYSTIRKEPWHWEYRPRKRRKRKRRGKRKAESEPTLCTQETESAAATL